MLQAPSTAPLIPQQHKLPNGNTLYYFPNSNLQLVKLDFTVEGGSGYQWVKSQAHAANQLFGEATAAHSAQEVAEFLDFRGITIERMTDVCQSNISVYFLRKYAAELFPLLREMFDMPVVTAQLFDAYKSRRRQQVAQGFQQTNYMARNRHYEMLYGPQHPLGCYAAPEDIDALQLCHVEEFIHKHFSLTYAHLVIGGQVDDELLALADQYLAPERNSSYSVARLKLPAPMPENLVVDHVVLPSAVQSSLRIGRVLPMDWQSPEYAQFMVLNTLLGGYFGSRLMSNLREEKGYTYGIYSMTQIFRGSILFFVAADVAGEATQAAVQECLSEIDRLKNEPVSNEELDRVRNVMMGDFIRSVDGTFEITERYRQMVTTDVTEQFSANYFDAVQHVTPEQLQSLARQYFVQLKVVTAGPQLTD